MPMTNAGMSSAIKSAIISLYGNPDNSAELQNFCDALGMAIVTYIQGNAEVVTGIPVATTGTATAQVGATTAPGTIM